MTRVQALALLGLAEAFTAAEVRRAYLRLHKKHKPESDPEGFTKLRASGDESFAREALSAYGKADPFLAGALRKKMETLAPPLAEVFEPFLPRPLADGSAPSGGEWNNSGHAWGGLRSWSWPHSVGSRDVLENPPLLQQQRRRRALRSSSPQRGSWPTRLSSDGTTNSRHAPREGISCSGG